MEHTNNSYVVQKAQMTRKEIKILKYAKKFALPLYAVVIHLLFLTLFGTVYKNNYNGLLFIYDFNIYKYLFCVIETVILICFARKRLQSDNLSETAVLMLELLYFLPGFLFQAVTNVKWSYNLFFFAFYILMHIWNKNIKVFPGRGIRFAHRERIITFFSLLAVCCAIAYSVLFGRGLTLNALVYAITNTYEIRADSNSVHWIFYAMEQWATYYSCVMITYYLKKKKYVWSVVMVFVCLLMFVQQANRIFLFFMGCAVLIGIMKIDNRKLLFAAVALGIFVALECLVEPQGGFVADVFRRFAIVPNRLGEQYFDYFNTHEPDYLRGTFTRIFGFLGIASPYENVSIARTIGDYYYGRVMGANTGLVGGGMGTYGYLSLLITPLSYVVVFKLFEKITKDSDDKSFTFMLSLLLASLSINSPAMLADVIKPSFLLCLVISLLPLCAKDKQVVC